MTSADVSNLYKYFRKGGVDSLGRIDIEVFVTKNGFIPGVFSLLVRLFDTEYVNFEEFFLIVYDLITITPGDLPLYIFQMCDVDESGMLTHEDAVQLISTLNSKQVKVPAI